MERDFEISGNIVDIHTREIYHGVVSVVDGVIADIRRCDIESSVGYIMPGFVDSHIHIESSHLTPAEFGCEAIKCGTVAVVADPHEIANVMGLKGIEFMRHSAKHSPIKSFFTIPSCVPATKYDVAGGVITAADVERMAQGGEYVALSEMMDIGGVLDSEPEVISKIASALRNGLPVDGHAPLLTGDTLQAYANYGISTDHESSNLSEALEKIDCEMKILIREGSACKNYEALKSLIATHPLEVMFCSDDLHIGDMLRRGHINYVVSRAISDGFDLFDTLSIASLRPVEHYDLGVGTLQVGDVADFIVVENLVDFKVMRSYIDGELRYDIDVEQPPCPTQASAINNFNHKRVPLSQLRCAVSDPIEAIEIIPDEIITNRYIYQPTTSHDNLESDMECDLLKIVYINRYINGTPQIAYCRGFGFKRGAIATTISHDSHNIIAVGCSDMELSVAINTLIESRGGMVACDGVEVKSLPLVVGGIMSNMPSLDVARAHCDIHTMVSDMGTTLHAPFMTLSFLSLCVIPTLKIGEHGLFDTQRRMWVR